MNRERRTMIAEVIERLKSIQSDIEAIAIEEQAAFEGLPEGLQEGERGSAMEAAVTALDTAAEDIDAIIDLVEGASA